MKTFIRYSWLLLVCLLPAACSLTPADLSVVSVTGPSNPVLVDDTWALGVVVLNSGETASRATAVRFFYSADAILDAGDVLIGEAGVPSLGPAASVSIAYSGSYAVDASGGNAGTHRIFAVVDPSSAVSDADRSNNTGSLEVKVKYTRLIIDTYNPTNPPTGFNTDTYLWLYSDAGTADELGNEDAGNPSYLLFARIDYTDASGIDPGTVLYVRLRGSTGSDSGVYAIRFMIDAIDPYSASWFFTSPNYTDTGYENDGFESGGIPTHPVRLPVGENKNRYLDAGETDWFELVLP